MSISFKDHVALTVTVISSCAGFLFSFLKLIEIPFGARTLLVGALVLVSVGSCLAWFKRDAFAGTTPRFRTLFGHVLSLTALCLLGILFLYLTAIYHNVRIIRHSGPDQATAQIEMQPPGFSTDVTVTIRVSQQENLAITKMVPASWNPEMRAIWEIVGRSPFHAEFLIHNFQRPQVFGIWYRLNDNAEKLEVDAIPKVNYVRAIEGSLLRRYVKGFGIYGGVLWLGGMVWLLDLWFCYPKRLARKQSDTLTLEP